jgi:hypothetical protein
MTKKALTAGAAVDQLNGRHRFVDIIPNRGGVGVFTYFRRHGKRTPLPRDFESAEWFAAYHEALSLSRKPGFPAVRIKRPRLSGRTPLIGVYLLMLKGEIVYVGTSATMPTRVATHRANGRPFDQAYYIETRDGDRLALEALLIRLLRPKQNRAMAANQNAAGTQNC